MKHRPVTGEGFKDYYVNQIGHGMPVFAGATMQRGHGMGNILRGLLRVAMPLIKSVGKSALKKSAPVIKEVGKRSKTWVGCYNNRAVESKAIQSISYGRRTR